MRRQRWRENFGTDEICGGSIWRLLSVEDVVQFAFGFLVWWCVRLACVAMGVETWVEGGGHVYLVTGEATFSWLGETI